MQCGKIEQFSDVHKTALLYSGQIRIIVALAIPYISSEEGVGLIQQGLTIHTLR